MRVRLLVALGGALGGLSRFAVGSAVQAPWSTLAVNVLGALLIGLLVARVQRTELRAFAGTGVLGGFTTFSGLALDVTRLPALQGTAYAGGTVLLGLAAAALGLRLGRP